MGGWLRQVMLKRGWSWSFQLLPDSEAAAHHPLCVLVHTLPP
jgi:hypothetical protein